MLGTTRRKALLTSDLITHAGKYHADAEIVSRETSGELSVTNWGDVAGKANFFDKAFLPLNAIGQMLKTQLRENSGETLIERGH